MYPVGLERIDIYFFLDIFFLNYKFKHIQFLYTILQFNKNQTNMVYENIIFLINSSKEYANCSAKTE